MIHSMLETTWKLIPKPLQDGIAAGLDRVRGVQVPEPPHPDMSKPFRVLIGPVNYAGQGYQWGRALEGSGLVSSRNYVHEGNNLFRYGADHEVSWRTSEYRRAWQDAMLDTIRTEYTHVLLEACFPILGGRFNGDVLRQVDLLRDAGITVGLVGHGTEIRLPSRHRESNPWSHFHNSDEWVRAELVEKVVAKNLALIEALDVPTFVSTAGLLVDVPHAEFVSVVIEPERWANSEPLLESPKVRVVHAPTNQHVKGTQLIEPIVQKLVDEGLIEYTEISGIENARMPEVFAAADVVLDQFRVGDYGVGACETMAAGRIVLTYVTDQVRDVVERAAGMPLPIPEVTVDTLEAVLRDIAAERDRYRALAAQGPEYVARLHNGDFSRRVLMEHFIRP